jgi:2-oxo-3-hexenedioate decarboxylase
MAYSEDELHTLAMEVKAAQDKALQIPPFTTRMPDFDLATAYEVAHVVHRARLAEGATAVGRKIGFTNADMWSTYGVRAPIWSYIYDTTVIQSNRTEFTCALDRFAEPKIEPEIVFRFRASPPIGGGLREIVDAIEWVAHGFEIVQSHFPDWKFQVPDTVADWALHATLLIGPPLPLSQLNDPITTLKTFAVDLACDGQHIETGRGSNVLDSPLAAISHLVAVLAGQSRYAPLQAGEIVTTGTITKAQSVRAGQSWQTALHGIPLRGLSVVFA